MLTWRDVFNGLKKWEGKMRKIPFAELFWNKKSFPLLFFFFYLKIKTDFFHWSDWQMERKKRGEKASSFFEEIFEIKFWKNKKIDRDYEGLLWPYSYVRSCYTDQKSSTINFRFVVAQKTVLIWALSSFFNVVLKWVLNLKCPCCHSVVFSIIRYMVFFGELWESFQIYIFFRINHIQTPLETSS